MKCIVSMPFPDELVIFLMRRRELVFAYVFGSYSAGVQDGEKCRSSSR